MSASRPSSPGGCRFVLLWHQDGCGQLLLWRTHQRSASCVRTGADRSASVQRQQQLFIRLHCAYDGQANGAEWHRWLRSGYWWELPEIFGVMVTALCFGHWWGLTFISGLWWLHCSDNWWGVTGKLGFWWWHFALTVGEGWLEYWGYDDCTSFWSLVRGDWNIWVMMTAVCSDNWWEVTGIFGLWWLCFVLTDGEGWLEYWGYDDCILFSHWWGVTGILVLWVHFVLTPGEVWLEYLGYDDCNLFWPSMRGDWNLGVMMTSLCSGYWWEVTALCSGYWWGVTGISGLWWLHFVLTIGEEWLEYQSFDGCTLFKQLVNMTWISGLWWLHFVQTIGEGWLEYRSYDDSSGCWWGLTGVSGLRQPSSGYWWGLSRVHLGYNCLKSS